MGIVSGGAKDFCDFSSLHNLHSVYFCYLIFIEPKFYWETRFFFTSFFEIRKFVKCLWAKFSTFQRERGHNFCFWGKYLPLQLRPVCFNLVQTFMYTLDLTPTGSSYKKVGEKVQKCNYLTNSINFKVEL